MDVKSKFSLVEQPKGIEKLNVLRNRIKKEKEGKLKKTKKGRKKRKERKEEGEEDDYY